MTVQDGWRALRLPRTLHPFAWWVWALGLAVVASRTTNPLILGLVIAVAATVVLARRTDEPWARAFRLYCAVAALVVVLRVGFRVVFGGGEGSTILFTIPGIDLPPWMAGIRLLGAVSAESLLGGFYDGLRLATMIVCVGAANALANPKRLLKAVPSALYDIATAVTVALSVFPQLAESVLRVRRARRLRCGPGGGMRALRGIVIPVLEDALDRSLLLAAAMDSRGYGRRAAVAAGSRSLAQTAMLAGLVGVCVGVYGVLDGSGPSALGTPLLLAGVACGVVGMWLAGRRVQRTRYRPDRWRAPELVVVASGVGVAVLTSAALRLDPLSVNPSLSPLRWPEVSPPVLLALLVGALPAVATPAPPLAVGDGLPDRTPQEVVA